MGDIVRLVGGPLDGERHAWKSGSVMSFAELPLMPASYDPDIRNKEVAFKTFQYRLVSPSTAVFLA